MKHRVLISSDRIGPGGGPPGYAYNMLRGLERLGSDRLDYIPWPEPENARFHSQPGRTHARSHLARALTKFDHHVWGLRRSFIRAAWASQVAVLHGHHPLARLLVARIFCKKLVYMPHSPSTSADEYLMVKGMSRPSLRGIDYYFYRLTEWLAFRISTVFVFPSQHASAAYDQRYPFTAVSHRRRSVESGAPDLSGAASLSLLPETDEVKVLFVGRYVTHKGYDLFVEAAEKLIERGSVARFFSIGTGPLEASSQRVRNLGWSPNPSGTIAAANLLCVPSRISYFDLLPLEAASLGKPIVFTEVGGNIDQLSELPDSLGVLPSALAQGLADAIETVQREPSWGIANREAYLRHFTLEAMADRWHELLVDLIEDKR